MSLFDKWLVMTGRKKSSPQQPSFNFGKRGIGKESLALHLHGGAVAHPPQPSLPGKGVAPAPSTRGGERDTSRARWDRSGGRTTSASASDGVPSEEPPPRGGRAAGASPRPRPSGAGGRLLVNKRGRGAECFGADCRAGPCSGCPAGPTHANFYFRPQTPTPGGGQKCLTPAVCQKDPRGGATSLRKKPGWGRRSLWLLSSLPCPLPGLAGLEPFPPLPCALPLVLRGGRAGRQSEPNAVAKDRDVFC